MHDTSLENFGSTAFCNLKKNKYWHRKSVHEQLKKAMGERWCTTSRYWRWPLTVGCGETACLAVTHSWHGQACQERFSSSTRLLHSCCGPAVTVNHWPRNWLREKNWFSFNLRFLISFFSNHQKSYFIFYKTTSLWILHRFLSRPCTSVCVHTHTICHR